MSFFKFDEDDLFVNTVETYPQFRYYIHSGTVYINNQNYISGANTDNITGVPKSYISLYEYNIDRATNNIYPFVIKSGKRDCFKTINSQSFGTQYQYGDIVSSSYNMSSSISRYYYSSNVTGAAPAGLHAAGAGRTIVNALKYNFDHYSILSRHYQFSSSLGDKALQKINLISIPTILYGSRIKKGSVSLKYFITGSLIGHLSDESRNGELIQIGPEGSTGSGSVAGVVLYNEGILALTGAWNLDRRDGTAGANSITYDEIGNSTWLQYGYGTPQPDDEHYTGSLAYSADTTLSASYLLEYSGTVNVQTMTMLAHAKYGELNHSNNPTFISSSDSKMVATGSLSYNEQDKEIKNIVYSSYTDAKPQFKKVTYISKVGIYDEDENLIGIAKVATPVRKTEDHQYTFKLKLDI